MEAAGKKLKIALSSFDYRPRLGGVATCSYEMANALSELPNVEVLFVAPRAKNDKEFDRQQKFKAFRFTSPSSSILAILFYTVAWFRVSLMYKPDAIVHFLWIPDAAGFWLLRKFLFFIRTPYFIFAHAVEVVEARSTFKKRIRYLLRNYKIKIFQSAQRTFAVSKFTSGLVQKECEVSKEKVFVINNGIRNGAFFPENQPLAKYKALSLEGKKILLTVTRLDDYKGIDVTLQAVKILQKEHPNLVYLVGGAGTDQARLKSIVTQNGLENVVHFLGIVPASDLNHLYNLCDIYVMPSREDWEGPSLEGFGIVFLEAAACAKPVVAGASGGVPDAVENNVTGFLVDPTNPSALAGAIDELLKNPAKAAEMGRRGLQRVQQKFQWSHQAEILIREVLQNVRH